MTGEEQKQAELQAERALKRGEVGEAIRLYRALAAAMPGNARVEQKLRQLEENLQPLELQHAKVPQPESPRPVRNAAPAASSAVTPLPADKEALLRALLERISARARR